MASVCFSNFTGIPAAQTATCTDRLNTSNLEPPPLRCVQVGQRNAEDGIEECKKAAHGWYVQPVLDTSLTMLSRNKWQVKAIWRDGKTGLSHSLPMRTIHTNPGFL